MGGNAGGKLGVLHVMPELSDEELQAVITIMREKVGADRFPHSPRGKLWQAALAKLEGREPEAVPAPEPTSAKQLADAAEERREPVP